MGDFIFSVGQAMWSGFCVNCPESADTLSNDLREIGPTYYFAPPRVFEMQLTNDDVYEYACHEANYAMPLMLSGARKQEANGEEDDTWLPSWSR